MEHARTSPDKLRGSAIAERNLISNRTRMAWAPRVPGAATAVGGHESGGTRYRQKLYDGGEHTVRIAGIIGVRRVTVRRVLVEETRRMSM